MKDLKYQLEKIITLLNRRLPFNASKFRRTPCQTRWLFCLYFFTTEIRLLDSKGYTRTQKKENPNMHIPNLLHRNYKKIKTHQNSPYCNTVFKD